MTTIPQDILDTLEKPEEKPIPQPRPPLPLVYELAGGYLRLDGSWTKEFEVRELTGRDEEALARLKDPLDILGGIIDRALVRVGDEPSSPDVVDGLMAGDWETVLLAVRIVTFGATMEYAPTCPSCKTKYELTIDLTKDIAYRRMDDIADATYSVVGRHGTKYSLQPLYGSGQRKVLKQGMDARMADINTVILKECVTDIDGEPVLTEDQVKDLPVLDRRTLLREIGDRRVGPKLMEVTIKCPACDAEEDFPLTVAALFQF